MRPPAPQPKPPSALRRPLLPRRVRQATPQSTSCSATAASAAAPAPHSLPIRAPNAPHGSQHATHAPRCAPRSTYRTHTTLAKRPTALAKRPTALAFAHTALAKRRITAPARRHAPKRPDAPRHGGRLARLRLAPLPASRHRTARRAHTTHADVVRRPLRAPTDPQHYAPSARHTRTHAPQRPASRDAADSPAHLAHNTLRATLRAQHIARFRSPPRTRATTPRRRGATQRAAQPAAASRSPSAHAPTAPHPAQHAAHAALCAPRFARNTVRASLHTHAPDRTVTAPHGARAHYARNTLCAVRFATDRAAPLRAVCSSLAHTHCHESPDAPRRSGPRPAVASHSVPNRASIAARSAQPATHAAHGVPSPHSRTPSARQAPHPSARQAPRSHKRPDAPRHGGPLSPPPCRAHFRLARQPRRPARSTPTRHTLCAFRFATDRTATLRAVRSSHAHTHSRNAAPTATQRAPQPAAASHPLRARAPAAPHSAQHLRTHTLRPTLAHGTLSAIRSPPTPTRNHNAPARRDAAGLSARRRLALASGSRADRTAPCATHFARNTLRATLRTQHIARRPLNTPRTQDHERPARRGVAVLSARRRLTLAYGSRANRTSQCATQRARNAPRTRPGAPFALTRAHTPKRDPTHRAQHAPSPPPPRTRFQLARRPHHTIRTTTRTSSLRAFSSSHARTHKRAQHATHAPRCAPRSTHRTHTALAKRSAALAKRPRAETRELSSPQSHDARGCRRRKAPTRAHESLAVEQSPSSGWRQSLSARFSRGPAL